MRLLSVDENILIEVVIDSIKLKLRETAFTEIIENGLVTSLAAADHRSENIELRPFREIANPAKDGLDVRFYKRLTALGTGRLAEVGESNAQVIVDG